VSAIEAAAPVRLRVNGRDVELAPGATVAELVAELAGGAALVAVERNGEIVPRGLWSGTPLTAGDHCEIVRFVQGG